MNFSSQKESRLIPIFVTQDHAGSLVASFLQNEVEKRHERF
jgi:hypothetical protein